MQANQLVRLLMNLVLNILNILHDFLNSRLAVRRMSIGVH